MKEIKITEPLLPDLDDLLEQLKDVWTTKQVTNMGDKHNLLEIKLKNELKVENVSLFNNGTIALLTAIKALDLPVGSEVITTPFTFAATPHCLSWNGLVPVFCDIEPNTMCIDADKIEELITDKTSAILGVHVYGFPCNVEKISKIAEKYNLKVIYDAAHAFSTEIDNVGIGNYGDITMFSFHATKLFNTIEGGCLTYKNKNLVNKIYKLRNFGICSEELVEKVGINGKMNEIQASVGLLNLKLYREEQKKREKIKQYYDEHLKFIKGVRIPQMLVNTTNSYQYYPIIIENGRNAIYESLKKQGIYTRKYFYPLCSDYECYKGLSSTNKKNLPIANELKTKVLCLPFYGNLEERVQEFICKEVKNV